MVKRNETHSLSRGIESSSGDPNASTVELFIPPKLLQDRPIPDSSTEKPSKRNKIANLFEENSSDDQVPPSHSKSTIVVYSDASSDQDSLPLDESHEDTASDPEEGEVSNDSDCVCSVSSADTTSHHRNIALYESLPSEPDSPLVLTHQR